MNVDTVTPTGFSSSMASMSLTPALTSAPAGASSRPTGATPPPLSQRPVSDPAAFSSAPASSTDSHASGAAVLDLSEEKSNDLAMDLNLWLRSQPDVWSQRLMSVTPEKAMATLVAYSNNV